MLPIYLSLGIADKNLIPSRWEQQRKINALKYFDSVIRRQEKEFARAQKAMARATAQKERAEAKASRGQSPKHKVLIELSSDSSPDEDSENESNDEEGPGDEDDLDAEWSSHISWEFPLPANLLWRQMIREWLFRRQALWLMVITWCFFFSWFVVILTTFLSADKCPNGRYRT